MKILVFKGQKFFTCLLIIMVAISFVIVMNPNLLKVQDVFSQDREIPIYSVDTLEKSVAITFDCAWGADDIPNILSTLKNENVHATFFVLGQWAEKYPDTIKMIHGAGHDVANHSQSHLRMGSISDNKIREEILRCDTKIKELTGNKTDLFRAPYGDYNNNVVKIAKELGYYTIQWNVDSLDWKPGISQDEILSRITTRVKRGSIILFHNDTPHTAKLLPTIIKTLKTSGYSFVPVSEMILKDNFIIDPEGRQKRKE